MFDKNIFSIRLKDLRKKNNLKQEDVGSLINVTKTQISDIEKGRRTTTIENIVILANYFDVSTDYLIGNGIFKYWEEIIKHKDAIIYSLETINDFFKILDLHNQNEKFLMNFLPAIFSKIYIDGNDIVLYPQIPIQDLRTFKIPLKEY